MSEGAHININFLSKYETQLKAFWNDSANVDNEGNSKDVIDKKEEAQNVSSLFFVEEGMTEEQFIDKNIDVAAAQCLNLPSSYEGTKTQYAVSQIVNEMLDKVDNGEIQFEAKKDVILGKMKFLDEETKDRVELYLRYESTGIDEELTQQDGVEKLLMLSPGQYGFTRGGKTVIYTDGKMRQGDEIRLEDGTIIDTKGIVIRRPEEVEE